MAPPGTFRQIFWQTWRDLIFIHWEIDPLHLERLLPRALEPDLFEGKAYIGLVPFRMTNIRSVWLPSIPGTSQTLETNVRTYVRRRGSSSESVPAVWFFSLEAQSSLAVRIARLLYGLPYFRAQMEFSKTSQTDGTDLFTAYSSRLWPEPTPAHSLVEAEFAAPSPYCSAVPGTIEYFLMERYALYAEHRGHLRYAEVRHLPYQFRVGTLRKCDTGLITSAGLTISDRSSSPLVHQAKDIIVEIGAVTYPPEH